MLHHLEKNRAETSVFFEVPPPAVGRASRADTVGAEPNPSATGKGSTQQGEANPNQSRSRTELMCTITSKRCWQKYSDKPICAVGHSPYTSRPPATGRKTSGSHKHLEGDNKQPVGGQHHKGLSDRLPVQTTTECATSHSTIISCRAGAF